MDTLDTEYGAGALTTLYGGTGLSTDAPNQAAWNQAITDMRNAGAVPSSVLAGDRRYDSDMAHSGPGQALAGSGDGRSPVASTLRSLFGNVDPQNWAAKGAAAGGVAGAIVGGIAGGGLGGAAGGTLVAPGVGTLGGGITGTIAGATEGTAVGAGLGAAVLGTAGGLVGGFIHYMENDSSSGSGTSQKPDPAASKPYRDDPGQLEGRTSQDVENELDRTLVDKGHWVKSPSRDGNGIRYLDNKGGSVIINKGYPGGMEGGDAVHQGPYVKVQPGGVRVPLASNPAAGS